MNKQGITRREFLKLGAVNAVGLASMWAFGKNVFGDTLINEAGTSLTHQVLQLLGIYLNGLVVVNVLTPAKIHRE